MAFLLFSMGATSRLMHVVYTPFNAWMVVTFHDSRSNQYFFGHICLASRLSFFFDCCPLFFAQSSVLTSRYLYFLDLFRLILCGRVSSRVVSFRLFSPFNLFFCHFSSFNVASSVVEFLARRNILRGLSIGRYLQ